MRQEVAGVAHRVTVLLAADEGAYLDATLAIGNNKLAAYQRALTGIRRSNGTTHQSNQRIHSCSAISPQCSLIAVLGLRSALA